MKQSLLIFLVVIFSIIKSNGQQTVLLANKFIASLDSAKRLKALYPFDSEERFNFHFFPKEDRKGLMFNEMTPSQKSAAQLLMQDCISDAAIRKVGHIMALENVLKSLENRKPEDHFRDPQKYYITIFGIPGLHNVWGWRMEGHHITFNFSAKGNLLISGTPGFLGTNPGIVQNGPLKGTQVLMEESQKAFDFLHSLSKSQLENAIVDTSAPNEIITFVSRKAIGIKPEGLNFTKMNKPQQEKFLQLLKLYVNRYTKLLAGQMLKEIQTAGLNKLSFAWAGAREPGIGKPHYYRIEGPTIIIEYDNSQNNANHVHTVIRDLKNDFGLDILKEHYTTSHIK